MVFVDFLTQYNAGMTSILKFFILFILSKWYGISFGYPFLFFFFRAYKIIINKRYNLSSLSLEDEYLILKYILTGKIYIKEINIKQDNNKNKEDIIKIIKEFLNNYNIFKKALFYKWNNYYWRQLIEKEIEKNILYCLEDENLEKKMNKKFNLLREPSFKIYFIEKEKNFFKVIFKYNSLINEKYYVLFNNCINEINNNKETKIKEKKRNKIIKIIIDFLTYPIYLILETLIILFVNKN